MKVSTTIPMITTAVCVMAAGTNPVDAEQARPAVVTYYACETPECQGLECGVSSTVRDTGHITDEAECLIFEAFETFGVIEKPSEFQVISAKIQEAVEDAIATVKQHAIDAAVVVLKTAGWLAVLWVKEYAKASFQLAMERQSKAEAMAMKCAHQTPLL